jgi:hypothetical protein
MDPQVSFNGQTWVDTIWDTSNLEEMAGYRNIELFYTSSDLPQLHAKQCHFMKNFYKSNTKFTTKDFKNIMRNHLRDKAVAVEHYSYNKDVQPTRQDNFISQRSRLMLRDDPNSDLLQKIKYNISLTVDKIPLYRLSRGYPVATLDLGV